MDHIVPGPSVFCVVLYTSYRKENEWKIHKIFTNKDSAISYAMSISTEPAYESECDHVTPHEMGQKIWLEGRLCGILDPQDYYAKLRSDAVNGILYPLEEMHEMVVERKKEYELYDKSAWENMNWIPLIAVVEQTVE